MQRSFDLEALHFDKKPDARYKRAVPTLGGLSLEFDGTNHLIKRNKDVVCTIKSGAYAPCWTWLPGDRVALGTYGTVSLYNARTGDLIRRFSYGGSGNVRDVALSPDGRYLVGDYDDETLRIWDLEKTGAPLLSLFVAGADWVAWTKEGYYAASPAGEKLMGWQVNHGPDQLATFHPASEFHKAFYRPDVIKRVLAEGSVAKALEAADKESGQTTQAVDVAEALPPEATILSPAAGDLKAAEVEVKAEAVSKGRAVASLQLLLDGRLFPGAELKKFPNAKPGDKQEATWKVTLPEGEHILNARAESDVSAAASAAVAVSYKKEAQEPLPTLYVLAVGINAYPGSLKLNWAVDDANAVAKAFQAERPQALRQGGGQNPVGQGRDQGGHPGGIGLAQGQDDGRRHGRGVLRRPRPPRQEVRPVLRASRGRGPRRPAHDRRDRHGHQGQAQGRARPGAGLAGRLPQRLHRPVSGPTPAP